MKQKQKSQSTSLICEVQNLQSNVIFLLLAKMFILEHSKQVFKTEKKGMKIFYVV